MKTIILIYFGISLVAYGQASFIHLTRDLLQKAPSKWVLDNYTEAQKAQMIAELRRAYTNREDVLHYSGGLQILAINLGDEDMMKKEALERFVGERGTLTGGSAKYLYHATHPAVIQYTAPHLFREEGTGLVSDDDRLLAPPSMAALQIIGKLVSGSTVFTEATRTWASQLPLIKSGEERRAAMRQFWLENERHFKAKDYQAVHPPGVAAPAAPPSPKGTNTAPAAVPAIARPPAKRAATSAPPAVASPAIAPPPAVAAPSAEPPTRWPWALLFLGLFAGTAWWWRAR